MRRRGLKFVQVPAQRRQNLIEKKSSRRTWKGKSQSSKPFPNSLLVTDPIKESPRRDYSGQKNLQTQLCKIMGSEFSFGRYTRNSNCFVYSQCSLLWKSQCSFLNTYSFLPFSESLTETVLHHLLLKLFSIRKSDGPEKCLGRLQD